MRQHTPTPWHVGMRPEYDADYITADRMVGGPTGRDEYDRDAGVFAVDDNLENDPVYVICQPYDEADARFIVRACNAHDDLLALAQEVAKEYEDAADWKDARRHLCEMARAAIAKAEATP